MTRLRSFFARFMAAALLAWGAPVFADWTQPADPAVAAPPPHDEGIHTPIPHASDARPALVTGEVATKRFRILYTAKSEGSARALAERIEQVRDDFARVLGRDWPGVTEVRLGLGRDEMTALALEGGKPPRWAEALAYPGRNIILMDALSMLKPQGEITLRHELSHVALGQLAGEWPRWFQEGLAMYLTGDRFSVTQYAAMFRAVTQDRLYHFEDLAEGWPQRPDDVEIAYAQSVTFVAHLVDTYGAVKFGELVDHVQGGAPFEVAFARAFKTSVNVEQDAWEQDLPNRYSWWPIVTGGSAFWAVMSLLLVVAWVRRRRVRELRIAEMAAQEAAEDAAARLADATLPPANVVDGQDSTWNDWEQQADDEPVQSAETSDPGFSPGSDVDAEAPGDDGDTPVDRPPRRLLH